MHTTSSNRFHKARIVYPSENRNIYSVGTQIMIKIKQPWMPFLYFLIGSNITPQSEKKTML